jgi:hypothetical protein
VCSTLKVSVVSRVSLEFRFPTEAAAPETFALELEGYRRKRRGMMSVPSPEKEMILVCWG